MMKMMRTTHPITFNIRASSLAGSGSRLHDADVNGGGVSRFLRRDGLSAEQAQRNGRPERTRSGRPDVTPLCDLGYLRASVILPDLASTLSFTLLPFFFASAVNLPPFLSTSL